jgi:hypothetical protein
VGDATGRCAGRGEGARAAGSALGRQRAFGGALSPGSGRTQGAGLEGWHVAERLNARGLEPGTYPSGGEALWHLLERRRGVGGVRARKIFQNPLGCGHVWTCADVEGRVGNCGWSTVIRVDSRVGADSYFDTAFVDGRGCFGKVLILKDC